MSRRAAGAGEAPATPVGLLISSCGFQKPWNLDVLADLLVSAGQLAAAGAGWIDSIGINLMLVTDDGFLAVDALCLVRG